MAVGWEEEAKVVGQVAAAKGAEGWVVAAMAVG